MTSKHGKWLVIGALVLGLYGLAETKGWAFAGNRVAEPITQKDLRSGTPGSWHYVYWYHGTRGK